MPQVVSDLSQPGLQQQLEAAGFDPALPTLWVLEGERRRPRINNSTAAGALLCLRPQETPGGPLSRPWLVAVVSCTAANKLSSLAA
jgi:hypothetical protein